MSNRSIKIDDEFKSLIKPMTKEEFEQLEKNVLNDGIRDPLVTWQGILIDGHNRLAIAEAHDLPFETVEHEFDSRDDVIIWIIDNQLGRRNLPAIDRIELAEKKRDVFAERAKRKLGGDRKSSTFKANKNQEIKSVKNDKLDSGDTKATSSPSTREKLAKIAGVSTGQFAQYEQIKKKRPDLLQEVRNGNMTIGGAYASIKKDEKREAKAKEVKKAQSYIASQDGEGSATLYVENSIGISKPCDLLLTDPPYSTDVEDIEQFANSWLFAALNGVRDTGFAYVFVGAYPEELRAYLNARVPAHMHLEQILVWEYKNTLGNNPKSRYKQNWQACLFYRGNKAPDLDCPLTMEQWAVQEVNAPDGRQGDRWHAWQKPLELCERFIRHSTKKGMTVYDPFACTGTTLVAAAKLGRNGIGYEVDPDNAEIAFSRGVAHG